MYKQDLVLNNLQCLICHETQQDQTKKIISPENNWPIRLEL